MKAKQRRRIHATIAIAWLAPGAVLSVLYAHSLAAALYILTR